MISHILSICWLSVNAGSCYMAPPPPPAPAPGHCQAVRWGAIRDTAPARLQTKALFTWTPRLLYSCSVHTDCIQVFYFIFKNYLLFALKQVQICSSCDDASLEQVMEIFTLPGDDASLIKNVLFLFYCRREVASDWLLSAVLKALSACYTLLTTWCLTGSGLTRSNSI